MHSRKIDLAIALILLLHAALTAQIATAQLVRKPSDLDQEAERAAWRIDKYGGVKYLTIDNQELTCDVYVPKGDGPFPAILAIHGGAWRSGTKLNLFRHARVLAKAGYVVVAINYRLAPAHRFPAQIVDCKAAVAWMRQNATTYNLDPQRIGVWGYSAGGHLAALLGVTGDSDEFVDLLPEPLRRYETQVAAVAAGGAVGSFDWLDQRSTQLAYWLGDSPRNAPQVYRQVSPLNYVTEEDPQFFFFHGSDDRIVPIESARKLHLRLASAGVSTQFFEIRGQNHAQAFLDIDHMDECLAFFDQSLKDSSDDRDDDPDDEPDDAHGQLDPGDAGGENADGENADGENAGGPLTEGKHRP